MNEVWKRSVKACADPERAARFFGRVAESGTGLKPVSQVEEARKILSSITEEQARILAALFSGSQALSDLLMAHPDWLSFLMLDLKFPRRRQGVRQELEMLLKPLLQEGSYAVALEQVREFKQREMLRIGARDLANFGDVPGLTHELSDLADICLDAMWRICNRQLIERFGRPYHQDPSGRWQPTEACVIGLGKLGGQELNYSSDVDVIFAYSEEGQVFKEAPAADGTDLKPVPHPLANHQFFKRLAEAFIGEVTRLGANGMLYRIDLRLRPEGEGGPLSRSLASFETYYSQWGQTWERMMLIKARGVAGNDTLAAEFLELIQPFRYPRSINARVLVEVGAMKDRIEQEVVKSGELDRNVKLGRGGIREIEFIVQSLQLLHAGRQPFLQGAQTLPCLDKLAQYDLLPQESSRELHEAYCFLRALEHRLQMEDNRQTHTIPTDPTARRRVARLMGFSGVEQFETERRKHTTNVRRIFDRLLKADQSKSETPSLFPKQFEGMESEWKKVLAEHSFKDLDRAFRVLREFVEGPGYVHVSPRTSELAYELLPRLFRLCHGRAYERGAGPGGRGAKSDAVPINVEQGQRPRQPPLSDPDRVLTRLDSFISAYGARATLFELWARTPGIFELLLLLFDRSEFLAELAIRTPDLVDELVTSDRLRQRKTAEETLRDLRHGLEDAEQHAWLRRYHQAELMRIGLRDILGLADFEQYLTELSALADACLRYALEVVVRQNRLKTAPFAIIGLGKLGGAEIDYGSDLDLLFVAESSAKNLQKLSKYAVQVRELISSRTEHGLVFNTDARLRPDGEKGLLVNTLKAYEEYYRHRAQLWEIQTLTRTRFIAGKEKLGKHFQELAGRLTNFRTPDLPLAAYSTDWRKKIHQMRLRIEKERTPAGKDDLAIKTGRGGLMDAEFLAQTLCLQEGWQEGNTLSALQKAHDAGLLPQGGKLMENYRKVRRVEGILRRWSYEGETVLPDDPAPYFRVSVRCGFASPEEFREALAGYRKAIREVYEQVLK